MTATWPASPLLTTRASGSSSAATALSPLWERPRERLLEQRRVAGREPPGATGIVGGVATTPPSPPGTYYGYPAYGYSAYGYPGYAQPGYGYPGYSGGPAYSGSPGYGYPGSSRYPAYSGSPGYGLPSDSGYPAYSGPPGYGDPGYSGQPAYPTSPGYRYPGYSGQPAYPTSPGYRYPGYSGYPANPGSPYGYQSRPPYSPYSGSGYGNPVAGYPGDRPSEDWSPGAEYGIEPAS